MCTACTRRAHTPRSRAQHAQVARMLGVHWSRHAQAACLMSRPKTLVATLKHHKAARTMSRHQIGVATPLIPIQVATSKQGRDFVSLANPRASRDANPMTRPLGRPSQVATPTPCRDLPSDPITQIRSRPQNGVATSVPNKPGRDVNSMSRPPFQPNQNNEVATSKRGHDTKSPVSSCDAKIPKLPSLRPTATQPCRDATSWSRPHAQTSQVATSDRCCDLKAVLFCNDLPLFFFFSILQ